jgi:hypothetical protein
VASTLSLRAGDFADLPFPLDVLSHVLPCGGVDRWVVTMTRIEEKMERAEESQ